MSFLPVVSDSEGIPGTWDWKTSYVDRLADGRGIELFSEASVTPDTTLLLAGPPRLNGGLIDTPLDPIGLINSVSVTTDNQLRPIWEMGTDFTYFTRGKTMYTMGIGAMVANKPSIIKALTRYSPVAKKEIPTGLDGKFWTSIDDPKTATPFGIMALFKSKGGASNSGTPISAIYLENCNISNITWGLAAQDVSMQENVSLQFDRIVEVDYS